MEVDTDSLYTNPIYKDYNFNDILNYMSEWTWQEMKIGLKYKIITYEEVIDYAKFILDDQRDNYELVLELIISEDVCYEALIDELICLEKAEEVQNIMDKWCFSMLFQLYLNKFLYNNVYEKIAEIGADFNHPKYMDDFIYYMPSDGIDLEASWIGYLKKQCIRFHIDCPF